MWNRQTTPLSEADFLSFVVLNHILILILLYFFITLVLTTTLYTLLIALLPGVTVPPSSVMSQFVCSFTDPTSLRRVRKLLRHCGGKTGQVRTEFCTRVGVANGTLKNVGLGKFWQVFEISEAFLISLEVSFLHGLFLLFLSLETFYQRVSGSDF